MKSIDPDAQQQTLLRSALRGLKTTGLLTALKTLLDVGGQLALARLLAPSAFGVFGLAQSLSGLVSCLTDWAGKRYLIQKRGELQPALINSIFTFELILGIFISGLWVFVSEPLLTALNKPEQIPFARWLALWILIERFMFPRALLDRNLKFGRSNLALVLGTLAAVITMISAAFAGAGPYTFIIGLITRTSVSAIGLWIWAPARPRLHLEWDHIRPFLPFGFPIMLMVLLTFYYTNIDYIIVQGLLGYTALGFYYASYRYPHYIHQLRYLISTVVFPTFTKAKGPQQLARGFALVTRYSAVIGFAPLLVVWILGEDAVRVLLEDKWIPATFCFQMFTLLAVARLVASYWYEVYVSQGVTRPLPFISAGNALLTTLAALIGAKWAGIEGAALLVTLASMVVIFFCCGVFLKRLIQTRYLDILKIPCAAAACSAWLGYMFAREPWINPNATFFGSVVLDFLLRSGFLIGIYGFIFVALDWKNLRSLFNRGLRQT